MAVTRDVEGINGQTSHAEFAVTYDGKPLPWEGHPGVVQVFKRIDDFIFEITTSGEVQSDPPGSSPASWATTSHYEISKDGKSMTQIPEEDEVWIFEKQP